MSGNVKVPPNSRNCTDVIFMIPSGEEKSFDKELGESSSANRHGSGLALAALQGHLDTLNGVGETYPH